MAVGMETMMRRRAGLRLLTAAAVAATMLGLTAAPASAWPIPLTGQQNKFLDQTRGNFPGDDDTILLAGEQVCRGFYTGQHAAALSDQTASNYGASPDQAAALVRAARGTLCPQAPG